MTAISLLINQTPLSNSKSVKVTKNVIDFVSKVEFSFQISALNNIFNIDPFFSNWVNFVIKVSMRKSS